MQEAIMLDPNWYPLRAPGNMSGRVPSLTRHFLLPTPIDVN